MLGHSFGAIAAYALVRHLEEAGRSVTRLFIGGARPPSLPSNRPEMHALSDGELTAEIGRLDGTEPEVLAHADLMAMFLPVLRADFRCVETYGPSHAPVRCPITVMGGRRDAIVPVEDLEPWRALTESACVLRLFDGDHFFINAELPQVARAIRADLARDLIASAGMPASMPQAIR
uniref:thioesterase II family protein n=1 Tax=Methylobacterium sp. B34 TaxID=95563 RepID=UPI00067957F7|nr:thioesterase domain-containing protein [Methylobacterium sp. B34]